VLVAAVIIAAVLVTAVLVVVPVMVVTVLIAAVAREREDPSAVGTERGRKTESSSDDLAVGLNRDRLGLVVAQ
jgi:hypothetical protein